MLERIVGLVVVVVAGIYLTLALALPYGTAARPGAGFFPILVGVFACAVGVIVCVQAFRAPVRASAAPDSAPDAAARGRALSTVVMLIAFCALMPWVGYPLVAFAFVTILLQRLGSAWRAAAITGLLSAIVSFYVFGVLLDVPLPRGPW
jgi:putative tricarboxylic transport membrane protein